MKIIKKLVFLFISVAVLSACSNNDDNSNSHDKIEGQWYLAGANNVPGYTYNTCSSDSTITFMDDGTMSSTFYTDASGTCQSDTGQGNWTNDGNGIYTMDIPGLGTVPGTVDFNGDSEFTFTAAGTSASLTFEKR
ncbi:MAG: lipocalin family protein [Salegentibacter sp.]